MDERKRLGNFEEIVLLAIILLREDAHGMAIQQAVAKATGRNVSIGALYGTLGRLARKEYVCARQGDTTPVRGGRAKRYYIVTEVGMRAVVDAQYVRTLLRQAIKEAQRVRGEANDVA